MEAERWERSKWTPFSAAIVRLGLIQVFVLGMIYVALSRPGLPDRFNADAVTIRKFATGALEAPWDKSYQQVGDIYAATGLATYPVVAGVIGYAAYCMCFLPVFRRHFLDRHSWYLVISIYGAILLGAVFLGTFSKDVFVVPVVALAVIGPRGRKWDLAILLAIICYAIWFRTYWFGVSGLFVGYRILTWRSFSLARLAFGGASALLVICITYYEWFGTTIAQYRIDINSSRLGDVDAQTAILPFIGVSNVWTSWVNSLLSLVAMYVPWPLLQLGTAYHISLFLALGLLWFGFFWWTSLYCRLAVRSLYVERLIIFVISFNVTQALFEPDYGSYLRHVTPLLPMLVIAVAQIEMMRSAKHFSPSSAN